MASAANSNIAGMAKTAKAEHTDLIGACVSAVLAALIMAYVASVAKPGAVHAALALIAVAGIVGAYLLIARSKAEVEWKAATVVGAAVLSGLCLAGVSALL